MTKEKNMQKFINQNTVMEETSSLPVILLSMRLRPFQSVAQSHYQHCCQVISPILETV